MSSDQMPAPGKTKLIKFPPSRAGKDVECPGYARGRMLKLRFDWYITSGSNVTRDVHWCVTVFYQAIENNNIANQIHGFTIDYGKFILKLVRKTENVFSISFRNTATRKRKKQFFFVHVTFFFQTPLSLITMLIYITHLKVSNNYTTYSIQLF